jgi:hypothetical protein
MTRRRANKHRTRDRREARKYERRHKGWHLRWSHGVEWTAYCAFLDEVFGR